MKGSFLVTRWKHLLGAALLSVFMLWSFPAASQRGALTIPRNVGELAQQAATIVRGHVVSAHVEPHPQLKNLTTVVVIFRVEEKLKGSADSLLTFRQYIWDIRDKYDAAGYRKGQELLLMLTPVSSYGLTSPAGLEQGRFTIVRDAKGNATAANGQGNVTLFLNLSTQAKQRGIALSPSVAALVQQHRHGPVALAQLEEVIRQFAGTSN